MVAIFAIGSTATAVAGERARGTLEVLLARPISRLTLYVSILVAMLVAVLLVIGAIIGGMVAGSAIQGLTDELDLGLLPLVLLNGFGLWAAFTTFGLAASVTFDRPGPAIGLSLAYLRDQLLPRDPRVPVGRCGLDAGLLALPPLQPRSHPGR